MGSWEQSPPASSPTYLVDGDPTQDMLQYERGLVIKGGSIYFPDEIHEALGIKPFAAHAILHSPAGQ
jgi:hypothetical protein